jgi:hypothetical protein
MICYFLQNLFLVPDVIFKSISIYLALVLFWLCLGSVIITPWVIGLLFCAMVDRFIINIKKEINSEPPERPTPNINKNLIYRTANEIGKRNIEFVWESVFDWIFENAKDHPKKYLILSPIWHRESDNFYEFKRMIFNMGDICIDSDNPQWRWEYACDNETIIKSLETRLDMIAADISKQTSKKVEAPEELKQMVKSLFWSV